MRRFAARRCWRAEPPAARRFSTASPVPGGNVADDCRRNSEARAAAALAAAGPASGDEAVTIDTHEAFPEDARLRRGDDRCFGASCSAGFPKTSARRSWPSCSAGQDGGLGLSFTRLTVGASDFSTSALQLRRHARERARSRASPFLDRPARKYVLPRVREALAINPDLKVMISPWSAPAWMKTDEEPDPGPALPAILPGLRQLSRADGRGVRARRRAASRCSPSRTSPISSPIPIPACGSIRPTAPIIIGRYRRARPSGRARPEDADPRLRSQLGQSGDAAGPCSRIRSRGKYVSGVAWHCYEGDVPAQSQVHDAFPDKDAWLTECSGGEWSPKFAEVLGLDDRQTHHRRRQQLVARDPAVEPRARPGARAAQWRLRGLPRRGDDRSRDRRDHPQRRILCARPCQPLRASRAHIGSAATKRGDGDRSGRVSQSRRKPRRDPPSQVRRWPGRDCARRRALSSCSLPDGAVATLALER